MTLEQQVTSLELSKRLKELGVKQETNFIWEGNTLYVRVHKNDHNSEVYFVNTVDFGEWYEEERLKNGFTNTYPAYLSSELGEMLPGYIEISNEVYNLEIRPAYYLDGKTTYGMWDIGYWKHGQNGGAKGKYQQDKTLINVMAKMLIYLLEQGLITKQ